MEKRYEKVGRWWNDRSIELARVVYFDGGEQNPPVYALDGWDGEAYSKCWRVDPNDYHIILEDDYHYMLYPVYEENPETEEFEIVDYTVTIGDKIRK